MGENDWWIIGKTELTESAWEGVCILLHSSSKIEIGDYNPVLIKKSATASLSHIIDSGHVYPSYPHERVDQLVIGGSPLTC
jgi:hypothetical protein